MKSKRLGRSPNGVKKGWKDKNFLKNGAKRTYVLNYRGFLV
jgi:hypothetical protein